MPTRDAVAVAVLAALLLFVAFNLQAGWVYAVDALLIGLLLTGWITAWLAVRGLTIRRRMPPEAFEGDRIPVALSVSGGRWPRFFIEIRDAVPALAPSCVFIPMIRSRGAVEYTYETEVRRRGIHTATETEVRSQGLVGLFTLRRTVPAPGVITVFPRYWPLRTFPLPGHSGMEIVPQHRPARSGVEVAGVREYRDGDSLSHVHWRSTARRGKLVVREFEDEVQPAATLLIDTRPTDAGGTAECSFEDLVRAAASIAHFATRGGRAVRIAAARGAQPTSLVAGWEGVLQFLAEIADDGTLLPQDVHAAALPPRTPVVALTPDADAVTALASRGIPVVAVIADAASYHASHTVPSDGNAERILLEALDVPVCVLRRGEEIAACLESCG